MTRLVSLRDKLQATKEGKADPPPIMKTLDMNVLNFGEGKAVITMHVDQRYHNPMGTVHGGIMTDLADASMGVALISVLERKSRLRRSS